MGALVLFFCVPPLSIVAAVAMAKLVEWAATALLED